MPGRRHVFVHDSDCGHCAMKRRGLFVRSSIRDEYLGDRTLHADASTSVQFLRTARRFRGFVR